MPTGVLEYGTCIQRLLADIGYRYYRYEPFPPYDANYWAIALVIDDSLENETVNAEIFQFSHKLYLGEDQENGITVGMLALYHENMKELSEDLDGLSLKFPHYLRSKSGISEAYYAAGIFKVSKDQNIPLAKFIRVLPDLTFFMKNFNAEETYNLIHLRTRSLSSSGARGSGIAGEWTPYDTLHLLCEEFKEATRDS
ncbi:hypothetical protein B0H11DRAFT_1899837 [Mycena galericulata]|nr:hypothetical protein B0H11DRAFT_1899837 [Mycena galericulata]